MKMLRNAVLAAPMLALALASASAGEITYNIVNSPVDQTGSTLHGGSGTWTVTGTITTDGTIGTLSTSDITAWAFTLESGSLSYSASSTDAGTFTSVDGGIAASSTALTFTPLTVDSPEIFAGFTMQDGGIFISYSSINFGGHVTSSYMGYGFDANPPTGLGDPAWTIATINTPPSSIPEPASVISASLGLGLILGCVARRRSCDKAI